MLESDSETRRLLVRARELADAVFPVGDGLVVLPSDAPVRLARDRAGGRVRYRKPQEGAAYALGTMDVGLFVAGAGEAKWCQGVPPLAVSPGVGVRVGASASFSQK